MRKITLNLAAGQLVLGPLLAATLRDHKEAIAKAQRDELHAIDMLDLTCTLALAGAQRIKPATTQQDIESLIDTENFMQVFGACWGISIPETPLGEAMQADSPSS